MELYKCDRCGKLMNRSERFCGHAYSHIGDYCETCKEELTADITSVENLYQKNINAILIKYGLKTIRETIEKEIQINE